MKLFYSPGACSLAPHIVLYEVGLPFTIARVDTKNKKVGEDDFYKINPKGYVPALRLDSGEVLTENVVILQYLADRRPELSLAPVPGTTERYRLQEWLNYVATEVHKSFSPLWNPNYADDAKTLMREILQKKFSYLNSHFKHSNYLTGGNFSVADAYLFTVMNWIRPLKIELKDLSDLTGYLERVGQRESVKKALQAEGLLKT